MVRVPSIACSWLLGGMGLFLLGGCGGAPQATLGVKAPDAVAPSGKTERFELAGHAKVEADVSAGAAYTLSFPRIDGTLVVAPDNLEASQVDLTIDVTSATASWQLVADVARDEFLHTGQHPQARFVSRALRKADGGEFDLYGDLTLHGVTLPLKTQARLAVEKCAVHTHVEFAIDRRAFGAISSGGLDGVVSDNVVVRIDVAAPRSRADCPAPQATTDAP